MCGKEKEKIIDIKADVYVIGVCKKCLKGGELF